jgi:hypothetical protein
MLRNLDRYAGAFAASIVVVVVLIGTYAQFALPYFRGGSVPEGCYFGDALIVFIACDNGIPGFVEPVLTWSWYLTWGHFWLVSFFVPLAPIFGIPILIVWIGAIILAVRWSWRTLRRRAGRA